MSARPRLRHGAALAHMTQAGIEVAKMFLEPIFKTPGQQMGNVAKMTLVMIVISRMASTLVMIVHDIAVWTPAFARVTMASSNCSWSC